MEASTTLLINIHCNSHSSVANANTQPYYTIFFLGKAIMTKFSRLKLSFSAVIFLFLPFEFVFAKSLTELNIVTEIYPPYNLKVEGKITGISVDVLTKSLKALGHNYPVDNIKVLPWARAYRQAVSGPNTVLFSTTRTEQREKLFHWVGPIIPTRVVLLAKKSKDIKISTPEDIKKYKIGVLRDDIGEQLVLSLGAKESHLTRVAVAKSVIKMMNADRVELWAYEENAARWFIKGEGFSNEDYDTVYVLKDSDLYYTFSLDIDKSLVNELQKGIDLIKKPQSDEKESIYDEILKKYQ